LKDGAPDGGIKYSEARIQKKKGATRHTRF
jgi:hypothetical protein